MHSPMEEVTILLVEDDEGHAELVKMNLERSGIDNEILHFTDGRNLIEFLHNGDYSPDRKFLIILDLNLPCMDGHQVLKRIKTNKQYKHFPVIVLTTAINEAEIAQCYEAGCNFYMTKPMSYDAFRNAITELGLFLQNASIPGLQKLVTTKKTSHHDILCG